ncbi:sulfite exporter TauE/SafE family protein [Oxalobacteraceae bacterium OM1]|nr:sulfite exporter TauE/SafE family protein [Oxalobacteraceae bacterium OM1]
MEYLLVLFVGVFAGTVGGIIGAGSSLMLMPLLTVLFGPQAAVPIMAIGSIMGNLGRVLAWRREIDWRACGAYCLTAIPGAALGVRTLLVLPPRAIELGLGLFFLTMIPVRRWLVRHATRIALVHLALIGGVVGFLTGIVVSTGPITVPIFTAYGLVKGAFIGTEAAASLAVYATKVATFKGSGALPASLVFSGIITGSALMAGSFLARRFVLRMPPGTFALLIDGILLASGLSLVGAAAR